MENKQRAHLNRNLRFRSPLLFRKRTALRNRANLLKIPVISQSGSGRSAAWEITGFRRCLAGLVFDGSAGAAATGEAKDGASLTADPAVFCIYEVDAQQGVGSVSILAKDTVSTAHPAHADPYD